MLFIFLTIPATGGFAHGGRSDEGHTAQEAPPPAGNGSMYAAEEEDSGTELDSGATGSPFSRKDIFAEEESESPDTAPMENMEEKGSGHGGHLMPQVKLSHHEMVSTDRKGYGVAALITVLSGLIFGILSFIRPNE